MAERVEIYLKGSSNYDASVRLLGDTDTGTIGLPNLRLQILVSGAWQDVELDTPAATAAVAVLWGAIGGTLTDQADLAAALALKAPLASPALTGTPTAPTAAALTSTTQLATTAFGTAAVAVEAAARAAATALLAPLASPALTGTPTAPTAAAATSTTQLATTAFVTTADALGLLKSDNLAAVANAGTARGNLGVAIDELDWLIETPIVKTYTLIEKAQFSRVINSIAHRITGTSMTYKLQIDGVDITSLTSLGPTTSQAEVSATGANALAAGSKLDMVVSAVTTPGDFTFSVKWTR